MSFGLRQRPTAMLALLASALGFGAHAVASATAPRPLPSLPPTPKAPRWRRRFHWSAPFRGVSLANRIRTAPDTVEITRLVRQAAACKGLQSKTYNRCTRNARRRIAELGSEAA